jgi:DNA-binding XRE family transcriptional regulator
MGDKRVAQRMRVADARAELRVTQGVIVKATGLSKQVITNAEKGDPIQRTSAHAILRALNDIRRERGMETLSIDDLDFKIVGE